MIDERGNTALHLAIKSNNLGRIYSLLEKLTDEEISVPNNKKRTPLHLACIMDKLNIVRAVLPRTMSNAIMLQDNRGFTALIRATENSNVEMSKLLMSNMSDESLGYKTNKGFTALHRARGILKSHDIAHLLLDRMSKKDISAVNYHGDTALSIRCNNMNADDELSERMIMIMDGYDICKIRDFFFGTILHSLCHTSVKLVKLLMDKMPYNLIAHQARNGNTFVHSLMMYPSCSPHRNEMIEFYLDVLPVSFFCIQNNEGYTILHLATKNKYISVIIRLLSTMTFEQKNILTNRGKLPKDLAPNNIIKSLFNPMVKSAIH